MTDAKEGKSVKRRLPRWTILLGAALCIGALTLAVWLQSAGYLTYLDGDKASELLLARRQADTHSLIQMDWIYFMRWRSCLPTALNGHGYSAIRRGLLWRWRLAPISAESSGCPGDGR